MELFLIFLFGGLLMICAEIFLPGGVLGVLGGIALLGAIISAFGVFGPSVGLLVSLAILVVTAAAMLLCMKYFPRTGLGRAMTLLRSEKEFSAHDRKGAESLVGCEGEAVTDLRPAGIARIGDKRIDVVTEGGMIARGERVAVVAAEGGRIVVRKAQAQPAATANQSKPVSSI